MALSPSEEQLGVAQPGATTEPVLLWDSAVLRGDTAGTGHQQTPAHMAGQPGSQRDTQLPTAPGICALWRGWDGRRTHGPSLTGASASFSTPNLSASGTEAQLWHKHGKKACQKSVCYHWIHYYNLPLSTPQGVIAGKFNFNHYLTKPTLSKWGAV